MPNIEELSARVTNLSTSFDSWTSISFLLTLLTAIFGFLYIGTSWMANRKARELDNAQAELRTALDRTFDVQLKDKDASINKVKEDAIQANSKLALELAQQQERAAKAETDLLALQRTTANRWISPKEFDSIQAAMSKFAGQRVEVTVFPVTFETTSLGGLIQGILGNAKWDAPDVRFPTQPPLLRAPSGNYVPVMAQGVYIQSTGDPASQAAAKALFHALTPTAVGGIYATHPLGDEPPRVIVIVGDKPTPLREWVGKKEE